MNQYKSGISETNSTEKEEIVRIDTLDKLKKPIKMLNLHPLERAFKGYDHISDLLLANY